MTCLRSHRESYLTRAVYLCVCITLLMTSVLSFTNMFINILLESHHSPAEALLVVERRAQRLRKVNWLAQKSETFFFTKKVPELKPQPRIIHPPPKSPGLSRHEDSLPASRRCCSSLRSLCFPWEDELEEGTDLSAQGEVELIEDGELAQARFPSVTEKSS